MQFEAHIRDWEEMAANPLWAVLSGKRQWDVAEFFATAEPEVRKLLSAMDQLGVPRHRGSALDFGCGVGRMTLQLSRYFHECWGVDISSSMLKLAAQYSQSCHFHLNLRRDLADFSDSQFDLVYSVMVLQHQPDRGTVENYIREFIRVLRPEGLLAFHLPTRMPLRYRLAPRRRAYRLLRAAGVDSQRLRSWNLFPMRMIAVQPSDVKATLESVGARLLQAEEHAGSSPIPSMMYYCTKHESRATKE